jgi:hypothetical protein
MLTLIVHGLLWGAPDVKATWRRTCPLNEQQCRAVGLTWRDKSGRLAMPGYDAINDVINAIDPDKLAAALNTWLVANHDNLPQSLAIDGKDLGHKLGAIVTLLRALSPPGPCRDRYGGSLIDEFRLLIFE